MHRTRFTLLATLCLVAITTVQGQASSRAGATQRVRTAVDEYARRTGFSGTVQVEQRGVRILRAHYGLADRSSAARVDSTTRFWVASITKLITATLVMQQVEAGRIDLRAPIRRYLPDYAGAGAEVVTVHHLLTHTSGLDQFEHIASYEDAVRNGMPEYQLPHTPSELVARYASGPLKSSPGTSFNYNNADYIVLGAILERVTGMPFERLLAERILQPLGMHATGLLHAQDIVPRLAATYMRADSTAPLRRDLPVYPENWWAAGALYSTASDLSTFARALYGGRLLTEASRTRLLTPDRDEYGYGLWIASQRIGETRHRFAQRPGQIMGANVTLLRYLDDDITIIILGNTNLADIDRFGFLIGRTLLQ